MGGYTVHEVAEIEERNEILTAENADLETYNQELRDLIRELKAQLNERCNSCPTVAAGQLYRPDANGVMQKIAWDE